MYGEVKNMVEKFTKVLFELLVDKGLSLRECLEIMSGKNRCEKNVAYKQKKIEKVGGFLLGEIMKGTTLSNSLRKCPYISFDDIYISFINFAERSGQLKETITFLKGRCERRKETERKLFEAGIYPSVVVCLAGVGCLYLYFSNLLNIGNKIFIYLGILFLVCICVFLCLKKILGENKLYESFLAISFLLNAGINLYDAVDCGAQIVGITTKNGLKFQKAKEKLLLGMDLENSFSLGQKYSDAFFFADKGGGKSDVFEKLAKWLGDNDERRRILCISLLEPLFILITGVFLIILVANVFVPYISDLSFI